MEDGHTKPYNMQGNVTLSFLQLKDHVEAENENDVEADIGKYIRFCIVTLKSTILIAEGIFDHYVNFCIFQEILEGKIA